MSRRWWSLAGAFLLEALLFTRRAAVPATHQLGQEDLRLLLGQLSVDVDRIGEQRPPCRWDHSRFRASYSVSASARCGRLLAGPKLVQPPEDADCFGQGRFCRLAAPQLRQDARTREEGAGQAQETVLWPRCGQLPPDDDRLVDGSQCLLSTPNPPPGIQKRACEPAQGASPVLQRSSQRRQVVDSTIPGQLPPDGKFQVDECQGLAVPSRRCDWANCSLRQLSLDPPVNAG